MAAVRGKLKMAVVAKLLRGENRESLSHENTVTTAALSRWCNCSLESGEAGLKMGEEDLAEENCRRIGTVVTELARSVELQRERIQELEATNRSSD